MEKLTKANFIKARDYIFANGGRIDRAWFRYVFEGGNANEFLKVLSQYQHENGGFGGLYYEFDYQGHCLKSTEIAVKYMLSLREAPPANHPMVQRTMGYLLQQYLPGIGNWGEVVVPEVNNGVHCRWVRFRGEDTTPIENEDDRIKAYSANEKACFAAFVSHYAQLVPEALYRNIINHPTKHILRHWDRTAPGYNPQIFENGAPYDLEYFQDFVPCLQDRELKEQLTSVLRQNPTAFMELDFTKSDCGYVHLPCDVVKSPDSILYPVVKDLVDKSLSYRLKQQADDGRWPLGWSFGSEPGLQKLQVKYEAYRTLLMLIKLASFGRIEL